VTSPMPWSIDDDAAFVTTQESVVADPLAIERGFAVKLAITGAGARTVTVVVAVVLPRAPVAVNV